MNSKNFNIIHMLVVFAVMLASGPTAYADHLFINENGEIVSASERQQGYVPGPDIITLEIDNNTYSIEMLQEKSVIIPKKIQELKKEYQILTKEKEQFKADLYLFNKKRKNRSSRTNRQRKMFENKKQELNEKLVDFSKRQESLEKEINVYNEIMKHLPETQ